MNQNNDLHFRDIVADRFDLAGARSWMSEVCGPHVLRASKPERIQFHHSGNVLRSTSTILGYVQYGTDVTIGVGEDMKLNCYSLSLPLSGEQELAKAGRLLRSDRDCGVIVMPFEHQELTIAGDCRKLQVAIPQAAIHKTLEELLQRSVEVPLSFEAEMDAVQGGSASWWRMVRHLADELERSRDLYDELYFTRDMESALIKGLILTQPHNYTRELRERLQVKLPYYLVRARDFIQANARQEMYLEDIEQAAGVSRFKLYEGFGKYFGLSPMAYLRKYRLTAVRQDLLEDRSQRNICEIALSWGFTHQGRFSSEYRKLFDETPSMTVQRAEARRQR